MSELIQDPDGSPTYSRSSSYSPDLTEDNQIATPSSNSCDCVSTPLDACMALRRGDTGYQDEQCTQLSHEQQKVMETEKTPKNMGYAEHCVLDIAESVVELVNKRSPRYIGTTAEAVSPQIVHDVDKLMTNSNAQKLGIKLDSAKAMHVNSMPSLKHSGSKILNTSKYREEFIMITKQHEVTSSRICYSQQYKLFYIGVVLLYALLLGLSTMLDWYALSKTWIYTIFALRYVFTIIFAIDVILQISTDRLFNFFGDPELVFDVLLLLFEFVSLVYFTNVVNRHFDFVGMPNSTCKAILNQLRLSSCISLLRMYKICKACQPLMSLSKGIIMSIRSLMWTAVFVLLVIYSCGIFTTWIFTEVDDSLMLDFWGTLPRSMYTLFTILTLEGWNDVSNSTAVHYPYAKLFFVTFVCFATLAVMNVVTGIILDTFLTANEKLTGEKSCKGRCDRHIQATRILVDALKYLGKKPMDTTRNSLATNGSRAADQLMLCSQSGVDHQPKVSEDDSLSNSTMGVNVNRTPGRTWNMEKLRERVAGRFKKILSKTAQKMACANECDITTDKEMQVNGYNHRSDMVTSRGSTESYNCAVEDAQCLQRLDRHDYGDASNYYQHSYGNKQAERSAILEEHMDQEDLEATANPSCAVHAEEHGHHTHAGNQDDDCTIGKQPRHLRGLKYRESIRRLLSDVSMEPREHMGNASHANAMIDMTQVDPYTILSDPVIQRALSLAGVPMYQAYEVLNLYYVNQLYRLTVQEFVEACDRLTGNASSKEILSFELAFSRRLDVVETALAQMGDKLDTLIDSIAKCKLNIS